MSAFASVRSIIRAVLTDPSNEGQKTARLFAALGWQVYKRVIGRPIILTLDNGMQYWADSHSANASSAVYNRIYEARYVEFVRKHVVPDGRLVDVGAHTGLFTLLVASLFRSADCFEPAPDCFDILEKNLSINSLSRFTAHRVALSNADGEGHLDASAPLSGLAGLLSGDAKNGVPTHPVECRRLDSLNLVGAGELTLLKIDTEGHEPAVLDGARDTLRQSPKALAMVENSGPVREWLRTVGKTLEWHTFALDSDDQPTIQHLRLRACA
jgi:FkbM family methyltransferase